MNRVFVILDLFLPFDPPHNPKNQNFEKSKKCLEILSFYTSVPQMTIIWCMLPEIWSMTVIIFCHFWPFFAFYPTNNPKNQNFEKMKKMHRHFIILDKCTKNHDHVLYCSGDMGCDTCKKTPGDIIISYMGTKNYDQMMYISWDIVRDGQMNRRKGGKSDTERWVPHLKSFLGVEKDKLFFKNS